MASVINTNIAATRTHNVYNRNNDYMNAAMTRVATGMKINSAKDGASTWAISEKMRERIRANNQANQNVQNDTAMLKTAQGGISNTIDILKTLKERAINSANDSNMNIDRSAIAIEVEQLVEQINDNAAKVKFNGRTLLNGIGDQTTGTFTPVSESGSSSSGTFSATAATVGTSNQVAGQAAHTLTVFRLGNDILNDFKKTSNGTALSAATLTDKLAALYETSASSPTPINSAKAFNIGDQITLTADIDGETKFKTVTVSDNTTWTSLASDLSAIDTNVTVSGIAKNSSYTGTLKATDASGNETGSEIKVGNTSSDTTGLYVIGTQGHTLNNVSLSVSRVDSNGDFLETRDFAQSKLAAGDALYNGYIPAGTSTTTTTTSTNGLTFYVGGEANFGLNVSINAMTSDGLGLGDSATFAAKFLSKDDLKINSTGNDNVLTMIDNAIQTALNEQTKLGAYEARLGYTSDNLVTMNENLEAADSVMRDSDIAKEMTSYMKYAVLSQASQYMLAQAGQNAFQVLNLLQQ